MLFFFSDAAPPRISPYCHPLSRHDAPPLYARQSARHRERARRVIDAPVVCVNISRRRADAEDPAWREDRLDFETREPGVASVLKRGTDAALDLDLDTFVVRVE